MAAPGTPAAGNNEEKPRLPWKVPGASYSAGVGEVDASRAEKRTNQWLERSPASFLSPLPFNRPDTPAQKNRAYISNDWRKPDPTLARHSSSFFPLPTRHPDRSSQNGSPKAGLLAEGEYTPGRIVYIRPDPKKQKEDKENPQGKENGKNGSPKGGTDASTGIQDHPAVILWSPEEDGLVPIVNITSFRGKDANDKWKDAKDRDAYVNMFPVIAHTDAPAIDLGSDSERLILHLQENKAMAKQSYVDRRQGVYMLKKDLLAKFLHNGDGERHLEEESLMKLRAKLEEPLPSLQSSASTTALAAATITLQLSPPSRPGLIPSLTSDAAPRQGQW
ncbi:uncharacterized protein K452DRAFT_334438 [Aplosporella prunicola CBS 121167]|uniref:Uncharacterized protein n=1 Tax=Aplosporella prunicola CBS 121167 TaxID=1176127 RepID=A0A6A6BEN1_9PEZI|nr:uncharacterized protein K452DRAFT_334438 [Aplosporella prunicola CBS 121167]KAF2140931.1 hypothetical protein K452DRAFT_334438 [Aplosporella prunicola CBS 121167]